MRPPFLGPTCLAVAFLAPTRADLPSPCVLRPAGRTTAFLGFVSERVQEIAAVYLQPAEIAWERSRCGAATTGLLEWDPGRKAAFRCTTKGWEEMVEVNVVIHVEDAAVERP